MRRAATALAVFALAACQPAPVEVAKAPTPEKPGREEHPGFFEPGYVAPPSHYEPISDTARNVTPGVFRLTVTPTPRKSEGLPAGAIFAFRNGYILETTLIPDGSQKGLRKHHPDWESVFRIFTGALDPASIDVYGVDKEMIPKDASDGFCAKTGFLAVYVPLTKVSGGKDMFIAAFEGDQWPPVADTALCGLFTYSRTNFIDPQSSAE
jgi:hypothetical protein